MIFFIFLSIFILIQTLFYKQIGKIINIYDLPDKKRKLHKFKTPVIGGINLFFVIILLFSFDFLFLK